MIPKFLKNKKIQLITLAILATGLAVGIYLVQTKQIFKPKATTDPYDAFTITRSDGTPLNQTEPNTYNTDTLNIKIKLDDLGALTEP